MAIFAFYPSAEEHRRADQMNFAIAEGASAAAAREIAERLIGEPDALVRWTSVDLTEAPPAFIAGLPVGAVSQAVWPVTGRGGDPLKGA